MLGFLRRRHTGGRHTGGRHSLGAAVTAIPSAPQRVDGPAAQAPVAEAPLLSVVPAQATPRVELGFRDGTSAVLEPASAQGQALLELADLLRAPGSSSASSRPTPSG